MEEQKYQKYVNPYTDFGFKKLFGTLDGRVTIEDKDNDMSG